MGRFIRDNLHAVCDRGLEMFVCEMCGSMFSDPESIRYNIDEYNGTSDMFGNWQYGYYDACPYCGSEDFSRYYEEDEDEDIIHA